MKIVQVLTNSPFLLLFVFLFLILYILRQFYKPKLFYHQSVIFSRSHKDGAKILIAMLGVSNNYQIIVFYKEEQVATSLKCYNMSLV